MEFLDPEIEPVEDCPVEPVKHVEKEKTVKKAKKSIFEDSNISKLSSSELVALVQKYTKKTYPKLTDLELEDLKLSTDAFGNGSGHEAQLSYFEKYITEIVLPDLNSFLDSKDPVLLILSSSAIRCVELLKGLLSIRSKCTIAKLFAKHFKLADQVSFLASHRSPIAIGTPARILRLGQEPSKPIDFEKITHIIIDTARDAKDRTVFDVPEVRKELIDLMVKDDVLRSRLYNGLCKIYFF